MKNILNFFLLLIIFLSSSLISHAAENSEKFLNPDWGFKGFFGTFDKASLQRGYQVYTEVCSACHSIKYLNYRN